MGSSGSVGASGGAGYDPPSLPVPVTVNPRIQGSVRNTPSGSLGTTIIPAPSPSEPRRSQPRRSGSPSSISTTSRSRPETQSERELFDSYQTGQRRLRRQSVRVVRSTSSRRMVRRVDTWTVFKMSLLFYLLGLAILIVAGVILWNVAETFGTIDSIQKSVRSLFDLTSFQLKPRPILEYTAAGGALFALLGTIMNTVAALLYNLISDIAGGIQIVVVTEPE